MTSTRLDIKHLRWRIAHTAHEGLAPVAEWLLAANRIGKLRHLPSLPAKVRARYGPERRWWAVHPPPLPERLRGRPGIKRDPELVEAAFEELPLQNFNQLHYEASQWLVQKQWRAMLPAAPRLVRAVQRIASVRERRVAGAPTPAPTTDAALGDHIREKARDLGLSAVGFAAYDERYTFQPYLGRNVGDRVIVCMLEQNYELTQQIPSAASEQAALTAYCESMQLASNLAEHLQDLGYRAEPHDLQGRSVVIHYGVESGLGQLGLNGQLLTRAAGSRCRITVIDTNAPVPLDEPADFGIDRICDACQVCVRRCPSGAITNKRRFHRGVEKAKIRTSRCLPVVAQANGCAVCMKVCPVQRYGLDAVVEEFDRSGGILGKETDDLEGYDWPLDGRRYGPGERPRLDKGFFEPPELTFDPDRKVPLVKDFDLF